MTFSYLSLHTDFTSNATQTDYSFAEKLKQEFKHLFQKFVKRIIYFIKVIIVMTYKNSTLRFLSIPLTIYL